mgnify:CR=1
RAKPITMVRGGTLHRGFCGFSHASGKGICLKPWGKIRERVCSVMAFCKNLINVTFLRPWLGTLFRLKIGMPKLRVLYL